MSQRDPFVFRYIIARLPVSQKNIDIGTQVYAIAVVFLTPPEILSSYHFFNLNSSLCRSPTFITLYFFHFRSSLESEWLQKGMASLHLRLAPEEEVMFICF